MSTWRIVPTTRRTSKSDRVDILDGDGRYVAGYVQRADALRMIHDPAQVANEAIGLFLESKDRGKNDTEAWSEAVTEISEGCAVDDDALRREMEAAVVPHPDAARGGDDLEPLPF